MNHLANMALFKKLMIYSFIVCIIPFTLYGVYSIMFSVRTIERSAIEFSSSTLDQVSFSVDSVIRDAVTLCKKVSDDSSTQATLRKPLDSDPAKRYLNDLNVDTYLNFDASNGNEDYGFYIVGENGGSYKSTYNSFQQIQFRDSPWYKSLIASNRAAWFPTHKGSFVVDTSGDSYVTYGSSIQDRASKNKLGVVLVEIRLETFKSLLSGSFGEVGHLIIVDDKNTVICSSDNTLFNESEMARNAIAITDLSIAPYVVDDENHSIVLSKDLKHNNWRIIGIIPSDDLLRDNKKSIYLLIGALCVILVTATFLSLAFSTSTTRPIHDMIHLMKQVERGNMDVSMEINQTDEIGQLGLSFNNMVIRVKSLMQEIYEDEYKLRKYELQALQHQINPHFLYNTLDSVIWLARMNKTAEIESVVTAMSRLFRISLSRGADVITISEEIEHIENYLAIQNFRYKDKFDYTIEAPASLLQYNTPKLILQPLIENAIYHGIKLKRGSGTISIRATESLDTITFEIEDTGVGISPVKLLEIQEILRSGENSSKSVYGILNVHQRIQIFFGPDYGLTIEGQSGVGTVSKVVIPKLLEGGLNAKNNSDR